MVTVHDVAAYVLRARGPMTAMKLQKLVYYAQAWSLVWDDRPLFDERIEAWINGPVVPDLYKEHKGRYELDRLAKGDPGALSAEGRETVDAVLTAYGDKSSQWLSDLTHSEKPWRDARSGLAPNVRGEREITLEAMAEFYGSLSAENATLLG
jgi:uncharacterized phage-associated protein